MRDVMDVQVQYNKQMFVKHLPPAVQNTGYPSAQLQKLGQKKDS